MYLTLHSYGQHWLIPYAYDVNTYPSDYNELKELAEKAEAKCKRFSFNIGSLADLVPGAAGTTEYL